MRMRAGRCAGRKVCVLVTQLYCAWASPPPHITQVDAMFTQLTLIRQFTQVVYVDNFYLELLLIRPISFS